MSCYTQLLQPMQHFHSSHQHRLRQFINECQSIDSMRKLKTFTSDIRAFVSDLTMHHSIEDAQIFPKLGEKLDIAHLEKHHTRLHELLDAFDAMVIKLNGIQSLDNYDGEATLRMVQAVNSLVIEHETAEEAMIQPDLLKQHFSEQEMQNFM